DITYPLWTIPAVQPLGTDAAAGNDGRDYEQKEEAGGYKGSNVYKLADAVFDGPASCTEFRERDHRDGIEKRQPNTDLHIPGVVLKFADVRIKHHSGNVFRPVQSRGEEQTGHHKDGEKGVVVHFLLAIFVF